MLRSSVAVAVSGEMGLYLPCRKKRGTLSAALLGARMSFKDKILVDVVEVLVSALEPLQLGRLSLGTQRSAFVQAPENRDALQCQQSHYLSPSSATLGWCYSHLNAQARYVSLQFSRSWRL